MRDEMNLNPVQQELESMFQSLTPAAARVSPVAAAFAAGRKLGARRVRVWQSASMAALLVAGGSWLMPAAHRASVPVDHSAPVLARMQTVPMEPLPAESELRLQRTMQESGLDGLPAPNIPSVQVIRQREVF